MSDLELAKISLVVGTVALFAIVLPFIVKTIGMLVGLGKDDNFNMGANLVWTYLLLFIIAITSKTIVYLINLKDVSQDWKIYERFNEFWTANSENVSDVDIKNIYLIIESIRDTFLTLNAISVGVLFLGAGLSGYMIQRNKNRQQLQNDYVSQFFITIVALGMAYMLYYAYGRIGQMATFAPDNFAVLAGNWWKEALMGVRE